LRLAPQYNITPLDLLGTPLPRLLADLGVTLVDSGITDPGFFGAFVEPREGGRFLSMPPGRPEFERDTVARMLLAEAFDLAAPPLPWPLEVTRA
jgi:hypothetical protein